MPRLAVIPKIHKATHRIAVFLGELGTPVTQGEAHVLAHLADYGDSTINDVHHAFGHRRSTLTSIIDRLERRALVERHMNPQDRRTLLIRLTPDGARLARQVQRALARVEEVVLARFSKRDVAAAVALLEALGE